jgi:triacylglycerol lipase
MQQRAEQRIESTATRRSVFTGGWAWSGADALRVTSLGLCAALLLALVPSDAQAWCWWNCKYAKTKYPIVLAHGFLGADSYLGIIDYWYGIEDYIEDKGGTVYVTEVSPANSSAVRGEELIEQLDEIRAIRGDAGLKFNLIGHSQGGLDIRYVAGVRPDLVASLTTVGSPHAGVDLVDQFGGGLEGMEGLIDFLGGAVGLLWGLLGNDNPTDMLAALETFSPSAMAAFNNDPVFGKGMPASYCGEGEAVSSTPAGPRRNYSWTGDDPMTNILDPLDPLFGIASLLYQEPNDGLVGVCGSHFGDVLRDNYRMNHLDEVNQMLGLTALFETDPKSVFRTHANRLKNAGL